MASPIGDNFNSRNYESYGQEFDKLPFERIMERFRRRKLLELIEKSNLCQVENILEVGPGYNPISSNIFPHVQKVLLEPSKGPFLENCRAQANNSNLEVLNLDVIKFVDSTHFEKFDLVILSSVMHEFSDAHFELGLIWKVMKKGAFVFIIVPNNESVHRQFGVTLGILESTTSQTDTERKMQQSMNYSIESLTRLVEDLNFKVERVETSFVKPHTHVQMQEWLNSKVLSESDLEDLYKLSHIFHPFNAEIFMIASRK